MQHREIYAIDPRFLATAIAAGPAKPVGSYAVRQIGVISIHGPISRAGWGVNTDAIRAQVDQLAADPATRGIMLHVSSPGGAFAGTDELGNAIANAAKRKPVHAYVSDLAASAAYWAASQAQRISASRTSLAGSLGTYSAAIDSSTAASNAGLSVRLYTTGPFKGAGLPGTAITQEHDGYFLQLVSQANRFFREAVAAGRGGRLRQSLDSLFDGRIHFAADALGLGLIDAIGNFEEAITGLEQAIAGKPVSGNAAAAVPAQLTPAGGTFMSTVTSTTTPRDHFMALVGQHQARRGCSRAEGIRQMAAAHPAEHAAWIAEANHRPASARPQSPAEKGAGHPFMQAVAAHQQKIGCTHAHAVHAVAVADPALRRSYVEACNA